MKKWALHIPKLNEIISFISKIEEGKYLGVSFNDSLNMFEKKKFLFEMKEHYFVLN